MMGIIPWSGAHLYYGYYLYQALNNYFNRKEGRNGPFRPAAGRFRAGAPGENLLLFKGEAAYNGWVDMLLSNPVTPLLEVGLLFIFIAHIITGVWVRIEDFLNAPTGYEARKWQGGRTIGSATMLYTAAAILVYLVYHMLTFRFTDHSMGFYQMVTYAFRYPVFVAVYVAGAVALALHLSHGMQIAFQTLGLIIPSTLLL